MKLIGKKAKTKFVNKVALIVTFCKIILNMCTWDDNYFCLKLIVNYPLHFVTPLIYQVLA